MLKATMETYLKMLTYKRPHKSYEEQEFLFDFIDPIPGMESDKFGNRILKIGDAPRTCFSAHVDTVHHKGGKQTVIYDTVNLLAYKEDKECLGADDASGCIVLMKLIEEEVPGLYIFHRGEERGGLGSKWIAKNTPEIFEGIDHCVAFDRRATKSIITHQRSQRCCSQDFVDALALQFMSKGPDPMEFEADDGGSFTDSASYTKLISECTNISIGYYDEHTSSETQDLEFLQKMMDNVPKIDWNDLPAVRDKTKVERKQYNYGNYGGYGGYDWRERGAGNVSQLPKQTHNSTALFPTTYSLNKETNEMEAQPLKWYQLVKFVRQFPHVAADILEEMDITPAELQVYIDQDNFWTANNYD